MSKHLPSQNLELAVFPSMNSQLSLSSSAIAELLATGDPADQSPLSDSDEVVTLRSDDFESIEEFRSEYLQCNRPVLCFLQLEEIPDIVAHLRDADDIAIVGEPDSLSQWRADRISKTHARRLDPLTKVLRRPQLIESLGLVCSMASLSQPVSLVLLDIDHLKAINDNVGSRMGDMVLGRLAELIQSLCQHALVARTRGGEFAIMVQTSESISKEIASIIQSSVNEKDWFDVPKITASFGVATIVSPCEPSLILSRADEAMFAAKANGRNKVVCYSGIAALSNRGHDELAVVSMENKARVLSDRVTSFVTQRSIRIMESLRKEANTDVLTDLFNRRYLDKHLSEEFRLAVESSESLCIALVDLDHFGEVNKKHGWPTGDKVLRSVALSIKESIRASDWVGRYGGEEICVVMPSTPLTAASNACERIRYTIDSSDFETTSGNPIRVTLSIGVVEYDKSLDDSVASMLERVSQLTLKAKTNGRNQIRDR